MRANIQLRFFSFSNDQGEFETKRKNSISGKESLAPTCCRA